MHMSLKESTVILKPLKTNFTWIQKIRYILEDRIDQVFSEESKAYIYGLLLGNTKYFDASFKTMYQINGVSHIFAISGLHVGVLLGIFQFIFKKSKVQWMTFILIYLYLVVVGLPYSAIRAVFMVISIKLAKLFNRPYDLLQSLSMIGLLMILYNPYIVMHTGFQYSFSALLAIGVIKPYIRSKFTWIYLPLALQIILLPLTIYHQNTFHILSFIINLCVIPLITVIFNLMFLALIFNINLLSQFIDFLIEMIEEINFFFHHDALLKTLPSMNLIVLLSLYLIIVLWFEWSDKRKHLIVFTSLYLCMTIYAWFAVEVYYLDIGQGDAILIKHRFQNTMIDTGPSYPLIEDVLMKNGVDNLDYVFLSHEHMDHVGGMVYMEKFLDSTIIYGQSPNQYLKSLHGQELKRNFKVGAMSISKVSYQVMAGNNASLILLIESYGRSFLFTGDIEKEVENQLTMTRYIDVLKVPHHGSETSSTDQFLNQIQPSIGVICVNRNYYGHPHKSVISRYQEYDTDIYLTQDGCVKITLLPFGLMFIKHY